VLFITIRTALTTFCYNRGLSNNQLTEVSVEVLEKLPNLQIL
jgi:hypothetical protein